MDSDKAVIPLVVLGLAVGYLLALRVYTNVIGRQFAPVFGQDRQRATLPGVGAGRL